MEYLVIVTVIVLAILLVARGAVQDEANALYNEAADKVGEATAVLNNLTVQAF